MLREHVVPVELQAQIVLRARQQRMQGALQALRGIREEIQGIIGTDLGNFALRTIRQKD